MGVNTFDSKGTPTFRFNLEILCGTNGRHYYGYDEWDSLYRSIANRQLGTIKKPKAQIKKIVGQYSGIFTVTKQDHNKLIGCDQVMVEEVDDLDFNKALFIKTTFLLLMIPASHKYALTYLPFNSP